MEEEEHDNQAQAEWINVVDRGGLFHVSNKVYSFFVEMERVIRNYLHIDKVTQPTGLPANNMKERIMESISHDDNVSFCWSEIGLELEREDKCALFNLIADLYVTIQGFSFAVELHKQSTKKSLQKSKSLCTKLNKK